jgi:DNA uptake protein ComE-like DNA-binding protein
MAILKYIAKGGRFKKKGDLQKMYTISPEMYARLAPYISIPSPEMITAPEMQVYGKSTEAGSPVRDIIEINAADSSLLCEIIGIGPVFASRIIKYRARTGGFYKKEQLMEVYGLDASKYAEITGQLRADPRLLKKININTAQMKDLRNNPYLRYKQINALIEYRKQHGNYSNIADLDKVVLLSPQTVARLAPYLVFE